MSALNGYKASPVAKKNANAIPAINISSLARTYGEYTKLTFSSLSAVDLISTALIFTILATQLALVLIHGVHSLLLNDALQHYPV